MFMSQKKLYRESIEDYFYGVILYYKDFYVFNYTIGDTLKEPIEDALIFQGQHKL